MNLSKKPLAMAYVPWQTFENVMEGECALRHGTIFEDLVFPFVGAQAACQADRSQNHSHSGSCGCRYQQMYKEAVCDYEKHCGPLFLTGIDTNDGWTWTDEPWPWEGGCS